jgi:hypothetical protein
MVNCPRTGTKSRLRRRRRNPCPAPQVGELALLDAALLAFFIGEPRDLFRPHAQRRLAVEAVGARIELHATDSLAGDHPGKRNPWIVGGNAGRIGTCGDVDALFEHALDRRRGFGHTMTVTLDKVLALIGHAVLGGDAAAEGRDPVDRAIRDGFGMVEEPVQPSSGMSLLTFSKTSSDREMVSS